MEITRELDAEGVQLRRRRKLLRRTYHSPGPGYCWHIDGYDKLKPYGICISAAIDGWSRYILWLVAGPTNNNPRIVAWNYMHIIQKLGGEYTQGALRATIRIRRAGVFIK